MENIQRKLIKNLYAIVIPSGGGKTILSRKFDQIDIDKILDPTTEERIRELRTAAHHASESEARQRWDAHNQAWHKACYDALQKWNLKSPKVLFCHTEEIAVECGAQVIAILVPTDKLHESNMSNLGHMARKVGQMNKQEVINKSSENKLFSHYHSHFELESKVSRSIMACKYNNYIIDDQEVAIAC